MLAIAAAITPPPASQPLRQPLAIDDTPLRSADTQLITHIDDIIDADCHIIDAATFRFISPPH
jgi:hypothetical protein